jgi:uncharacterized membrane protein
MKRSIKLPLDMKIVLVVILMSIFFILVPLSMILRMLFSLLLLLFVPGYALVSVLFPRRGMLTGIERLTLSVVMSIAITILDGFILHYTIWCVRTTPIVLSLSGLSALMLLLAFSVRMRLLESESFDFDLSAFLVRLKAEEKPTGIEKAVIVAFIIAICVACGIMIHAKLTFPEDHFTSFYILGEDGKIGNYTTDLYLGAKQSTIVGIENHEGKMVNYTLKVMLTGSEVAKRELSLENGDKKLEDVSFDVTCVGPRMKLEFLLFKEHEKEPYRTLHLWVASHLDFERPELIRKYALSDVPEVLNSDFEWGHSGWLFTRNRPAFRNATGKHEENAMIKGYARDNETGLPIPYARIDARDNYGWSNHTQTNEIGYYELKTIPGRIWLNCWNEIYTSEVELDVTRGEESIINFSLDVVPLYSVTIIPPRSEEEPPQFIVTELPLDKLPRGVVAVVKGTVIDSVTGSSIANASVRFFCSGFERSTTTDRNGHFELPVLAKSLSIKAYANGYYSDKALWIRASQTQDVTIKLTPEGSKIKGWISDESGNPIPDVRIRIEEHAEQDKWIYYRTTSSNSSGFYELKTIAGHFRLRAEKEEYFVYLTESKVEYGEVKEINIVLKKLPETNAVVHGYVLFNGMGLSGVKVMLRAEGYERRALTDESGYYVLEKVPEGQFRLCVVPEVYIDDVFVGDPDTEYIKLNLTSKQRLRADLKLDASPRESFEIAFYKYAPAKFGDHGTVYQDVYSEDEGIAMLSFKLYDSYHLNKSRGYLFKQALLNDVVLWEDDIAGDEGWQEIKLPVTLNAGRNRLAFRLYAKQGLGGLSVKVLFDDVRIESIL